MGPFLQKAKIVEIVDPKKEKKIKIEKKYRIEDPRVAEGDGGKSQKS
jgi:hypothetical protein